VPLVEVPLSGRKSQLPFSFGIWVDMPSRFDLEFPAECDDEYWEHPDPLKRFKQPPGILSTVTFSILIERLMSLYDIVLRAVVYISDAQIRADLKLTTFQYPLTKQKISTSTTLEGLDRSELTRRVLSEADSALNKWIDIIPKHCNFCSASRSFSTDVDGSKMGPRWPRRSILSSICHSIRPQSPAPHPHPSIKPPDA
jgi:hypothetical protein